MEKSAFVSIEVVDGKVVNIEGNFQGKKGLWGELNSAPIQHQKVNDVLNLCAKEGYEHFATETVGKKTVYRMKLVAK